MQYHLVECGSSLALFEEWLPTPQPPPPSPETTVFLCFRGGNKLVATCCQFVRSRLVNIIWMALVLVSTALACAIQPRYEFPKAVNATLLSIQCVCLLFFWVRMLADIVASGILCGSDAFFKNIWNVFELVMNVFGILQLIPPMNHIRWMRAFAALRPVRFLVQVQCFAPLVTPIVRAAPYLVDVSLAFIVLCFWLATIGVATVGNGIAVRSAAGEDGRQVSLNSPHGIIGEVPLSSLASQGVKLAGTASPRECAASAQGNIKKTAGVTGAAPAKSQATYYQFKNVGAALLVMLQIGSVDNWYQPLESIMDVLGSGAAVYAVLILLVGFCTYALTSALLVTFYESVTAFFQGGDADSETLDGSGREPWILSHDNCYSAVRRDVACGAGEVVEPKHHNQGDYELQSSTKRYDLRGSPSREYSQLRGRAHAQAAEENTLSVRLGASTERSSDNAWGDPRAWSSTRGNGHSLLSDLSPYPAMPSPPSHQSTSHRHNRSLPPLQPNTNIHDAIVWVRGTPGDRDHCSTSFLASARLRGFWWAFARLEATTSVAYDHYLGMRASRRRVAGHLHSPMVALVLSLLTITNVILLAVVNTGMNRYTSHDVMITSAAISLVFLFVVFVKLAVLGPLPTLCDAWNYADFAGGVSGILELAIPDVFRDYPVAAGILRVLRILHVFKYLLPNITRRRRCVSFASWLLLTVGVIVLYALLGMQLFSVVPSVPEHVVGFIDPIVEYGDFSTFWTAILSVFTTFTGANVSSKITRVFETGTIPTGVLFFLTLVFITACLLHPLLLAILIDTFKCDLERDAAAMSSPEDNQPPPPLQLPALPVPDEWGVVAAADTFRCPSFAVGSHEATTTTPTTDSPFGSLASNPTKGSSSTGEGAESPHRRGSTTSSAATDAGFYTHSVAPLLSQGMYSSIVSKLLLMRCNTESVRDAFGHMHLVGEGAVFLWSLPKAQRVHRALLWFLGSPIFRVFSVLSILMGFVALFFERHTLPTTVEQKLWRLNLVYVILQCSEMLIKWCAYGALPPSLRRPVFPDVSISHQRPSSGAHLLQKTLVIAPYFCDPLNWLDFAANGLGFAGIFYSPLRVGRVLHLLRLFTSPELPNPVFMQITSGVWAVVRVAPLAMGSFMLFAIVGLHFFAGRMHFCTDLEVTSQAECWGIFPASSDSSLRSDSDIPGGERTWEATAFRYDHVGHALLSVLVVTTANNWTTLMAEAMSVPHYSSPLNDGSRPASGFASVTALSSMQSGYYVVYFVGIVLVLRLFVLRSITAVMAVQVSCAIRRDRSEDEAIYLFGSPWRPCGASANCQSHPAASRGTSDPLDGASAAVEGSTSQPWQAVAASSSVAITAGLADLIPPLGFSLSARLHSALVYRFRNRGRPVVDYAVGLFVLIHAGFISARHFGEPSWQTTMFNVLDYIGIGVYAVEAIARILAYGVRHFLARPRYGFDLVVLVLLIVAVAAPNLGFFRSFVALRLLLLSGIDMTLRRCLHNWNYILTAVGLYFFVLMAYAVVGVHLFGGISTMGTGNSTEARDGAPALAPLGVSGKRNFSTLIGALLVLFDCSTGDNWHLVMLACGRQGERPGAPGTHVSVVFFCTFVVIVNMILVQLVLATVVAVCPRPAVGSILEAFRAVRTMWADESGPTLCALTPEAFARFYRRSALHSLHQGTKDAQLQADGSQADALLPLTDQDIREALWFVLGLNSSADAMMEGPPMVYYTDTVEALLARATRWCRGEQRWPAEEVYHVSYRRACPHHSLHVADPTQGVLSRVADIYIQRLRRRQQRSQTQASLLPTNTAIDGRVQFTCEAVLAGSPDRSDDGGDVLNIRSGDVLVPTGALAIPNTNLFLFGFPDEGDDYFAMDELQLHTQPQDSSTASFHPYMPPA